MSIVQEVEAAAGGVKLSTTALACIACVVAGITGAEVFEHTFRLEFGPVHVRGMGVRLKDAAADAAKAALKHERAASVITAKAETAAVASAEHIRTVTLTRIQKVPYAVPVAADCPVPAAAVSLLQRPDDPLPGPAAGADAAAPAVALSDVVAHDLAGRGAYEETADRLKRLQQWVRDQQALDVKPAP